MESSTLSRYAKRDDGKLIIDIDVAEYAELFDEWDNTASYLKRDLDADLVEYLYDCFEEAKKVDFVIQITVPKKDHVLQDRVRKSITRYFNYVASKELQKFKSDVKRLATYFISGFFFIFLYVLMGKSDVVEQSIFLKVLKEGLYLFGWVSLWHVTTGVLYELKEAYSVYKIHTRIAKSEVTFVN